MVLQLGAARGHAVGACRAQPGEGVELQAAGGKLHPGHGPEAASVSLSLHLVTVSNIIGVCKSLKLVLKREHLSLSVPNSDIISHFHFHSISM